LELRSKRRESGQCLVEFGEAKFALPDVRKEAVGIDRVVNAAAAYHLYPGPSIVIDMGTATKFDVVTASGELIGGVIAPGLQLTADALTNRAAKLGQVALKAPPQTLMHWGMERAMARNLDISKIL